MEQNDNLLLSNFIDRYQQEVSFINEAKDEQKSIDDTFHKAYNCLLKFAEENNKGLDFVITPLSTSLLGSLSKGIMIPDVPIGIIITSKDSTEREIYRKVLLQNILCYIGIINVLEDVSLSGLIKTYTKETPSRLYGYITYDKNNKKTQLCGLDNILHNHVDWNNKDHVSIIKEMQSQYNNAGELILNQNVTNEKLYYCITPYQYEIIKKHIIKTNNFITQTKNHVEKETLSFASHRVLCEQTGLCTSYYFFNPPLIKADNGAYSNYGNFVITVNKQLSSVWEKILCFFSLQLLSSYRVYFQKKIESELLQSNLKSAKSAIMSRNMSHNLGSHVMAYLKQHLSSVTTMLNDNVLTLLCGEKVNYEKLLDYLEKNVPDFENLSDNTPINLSPKDKVGSHLALPFLVGLGHFVSYLQERQDFIATISTDYIPYYATVNFKDSVYDELNPDKRYERHQDRKNLQLDNILLGNIARSEGLGRCTSPTRDNSGKLCDIVLKYKDFNGNPCSEETAAYDSLENLRQFNVSLPGGIVGRQAIFSIIENVIRNAAKHGSWRDIGQLELTINKFDPLVDFIPDDDNKEGHKSLREVVESYYLPASDIGDLYIITLTDNTVCSEEALQKLRFALDDDYVDSYGLMKSANKGLKEMRISAAWLRAIKDEAACVNMLLPESDNPKFIKENKLQAPIIYARISVGEDWREHLQYIFCLPKPKILAVVSDYLAKQCHNIQLEGCRFYTEEEFSSEKNKSYEFMLCGNGRYNRLRPYASARIFTFSQSGITREDLLSLKDNDSLSRLLERLYRNIFGYNEGDLINIDDKKACDNMERRMNDSIESLQPIEKLEILEDNTLGLAQGIYIKRGNVYVSDGKICGKYIYRTHHDSFDQFAKFMDAKIKVEFVEGITGNNSTDRLIRNEEIDGPWFYRHLHAMKQNVAICDERLFSKITGLEETDFTREKIRLATADNMNEMKQYYTRLAEEKSDIIEKFDDPAELNSYVSTLRKALQVNQQYSKGITAASYVQKRIHVFTFIQDAENSAKYYLIGVSYKNGSPKYKDEGNHCFECLCARLAELSWSEESGLLVHYFSDGEYCEGFFDYLTVHQGLLDKLYEAFGIKDLPQSKDLLTKGIYEHFCKESVRQIIPVQIKSHDKILQRSFLSRMMVHSGRSKPGVQDMPQVLPFIQYAALEHAVMDCKYSLVELLDHARYEQ